MSKVEPHPTDTGKFQSTFDDYGHGKGNGKSRAAVYKHHSKSKAQEDLLIPPKSERRETGSQYTDSNYTKSSISENEEEITPNPQLYEHISWLDNDEETVQSTIPQPIRKIATGKGAELNAAQLATQTHLIKWGYMGVDRAITQWGREVMLRPEWALQRSTADYEALEGATTNLMQSYGVNIQLSPSLVWGTVVAAAYVPPVAYVSRNADPTTRAKLGLWVKTVLLRPSQWFKRRRRASAPPTDD